MLRYSLIRNLAVALPFLGSAILLFSCQASSTQSVEPISEPIPENMMTEYSENLSIVMSENGLKSYHFETPLMEGYTLARDPYREFRKGVKITMFEEDSSSIKLIVRTSFLCSMSRTRPQFPFNKIPFSVLFKCVIIGEEYCLSFKKDRRVQLSYSVGIV